ncbi:MAG: hypothetical protein KF851_05710 [Pirellulaceae bacterium]|nr:hypothetical protein [Pirellulaceae bacterium]
MFQFSVTQKSSVEQKIALFRSLFRGREDVYPQRFESRTTGKLGYSPACAHEWVRGVCEKPRIKCAQFPHRKFLPVTEDVIRWHLTGVDDRGTNFVAGVYPMLLDETCFFLAMDLDKATWQQDAQAILETCRQLEVPASLERSRSGNGGHLWIFFQQAISAALARRLGTHILTETMDRRPDIGLDSYDRLFPNQDTLPKGGFGNLIALPLQKRPRSLGNCVFIDHQRQPYADQWEFLSSVNRLSAARVQQIVDQASRCGRVVGVRMAAIDEDDPEPWSKPPKRKMLGLGLRESLPVRLKITLADMVYVEKQSLPPALRNQLLRVAAFQNPEFYKAQAMRLPTFGKPRIICCAEEHSHHLAIPRGCLEDVLTLLGELGIDVAIEDERQQGQPLDVVFQGQLRPSQLTAARKMLENDSR